MGSLSRRNFLQAGGAAAAGAVTLRATSAEAADAGSVEVLSASSIGVHTMTAHEPEVAEPVVMFVRDAAAGEIAVLVDGDEVVFRDRALVAKVQRIITKERR
jgi:hypothetical protein